MEGNLSSGNMISGSGGSFDLQNSMRVNQHQQQQQNPFNFQQQHHQLNVQSSRQQGGMNHPVIHESFPLRMGTIQECNRHNQTISLSDFGKGDRGKSSMSDEDEPSFNEDGQENRNDENRGKNMSQWHRVKWSDPMVRLLITAVSYLGEDTSVEIGGGARRKYLNLQKKGKWRSISKVMAERGHFVSPQQCEDKFNDLNKRYKRLNEILGRGTSCEVVENPSLLDMMDHVSDKAKDEVKKILNSKHLYYEEMCSYHNGNRLHLPHDPELQRSLRFALRARDDHENDGRRGAHDDLDLEDEDHDPYIDDHDEYDDHQTHHNHGLNLDHRVAYGVGEGSSKRVKPNETQLKVQGDMNQEGVKANLLQDQWMKHRLVQVEEQKVHIQAQMLELERERFKWQRFRRKKDMELEMMKMENEKMKLENEQMTLELKRKEMSTDLS